VYNNRLQPVLIELGTASSPAANSCLVYNYYSGYSFPNPPACAAPTPTGSNNGNVLGYFYRTPAPRATSTRTCSTTTL